MPTQCTPAPGASFGQVAWPAGRMASPAGSAAIPKTRRSAHTESMKLARSLLLLAARPQVWRACHRVSSAWQLTGRHSADLSSAYFNGLRCPGGDDVGDEHAQLHSALHPAPPKR
ncbi:hypothetical protein FNU79_00585 [Deinococcus detaillensis]|uniref:Uncharacterized protein n=1 Tax=Deinococcus detaillensis TaxID=2592048 RepID=A0A553V5N8_9DEIO|nr:hypothetical protein [Deinococcus detaillensis]TSA87790.1 hypothetical protein FNU79_00585 [Deinococcus detaillensis]